MRGNLKMALLAGCALLAACDRREGAGGLTPAEERKLDEAAKMLDDNRIDVPPDSPAANEAEMEALEAKESAPAESPPGNEQ